MNFDVPVTQTEYTGKTRLRIHHGLFGSTLVIVQVEIAYYQETRSPPPRQATVKRIFLRKVWRDANESDLVHNLAIPREPVL